MSPNAPMATLVMTLLQSDTVIPTLHFVEVGSVIRTATFVLPFAQDLPRSVISAMEIIVSSVSFLFYSACPDGTYADSDTGTRLCITDCPDYTATGGRNLYGDPLTHTCEPKCIKPLMWADFQTRDCQSPCSALPIPTYS